MSEAAALLKEARREAGLTQAELARRLGVSQAAVSKLERPGSNATIATLEDALRETGQRLVLSIEPVRPGIDETLVFEQLRLSPDQRLAQLEGMYEWGRELTRTGARGHARDEACRRTTPGPRRPRISGSHPPPTAA